MKPSQTPAPAECDLSVQHLLAEIARLDVLIRGAVQRWRLAGQNPAESFRGLYVVDGEVDHLLARPLASSWGQMVELPPSEASALASAEAEASRRAEALAGAALQEGHEPRLKRLVRTFGLGSFEQDALLICIAPALDLRYQRVYAYLQDDVTRKRPTVNLVLDLLAPAGAARFQRLFHFADDAPLFQNHLLERVVEGDAGRYPLLGQALAADDAIVGWLLGKYLPPAELGIHVRLVLPPPETQSSDELQAGAVWRQLQDSLPPRAGTFRQAPLVVCHGPDDTSQQAACRLCARSLDRPLLLADMEGTHKAGLAPLRTVQLALRDARLSGAIPVLHGWDACLNDGGTLSGNPLIKPAQGRTPNHGGGFV